MRFAIAVLLTALSTATHAALTISFEPANPTPADTIVVTIRDSVASCPQIIPRYTRFVPPNQVRVEYTRIGDCAFAPFSESKTSIGRLPAGSYTIGLSPDSSAFSPPPGPEITVPFTVSYVGGPNGDLPSDDYSGQYLTGASINGAFVQQYGEGVTIEQFGEKSFLTLLTYDGEGRATWYVMTNARWTYNVLRGRHEFAGSVYRASRGPESPPSVSVTPVGTAAWYPAGFDTLVFEGTINGTSANRTLRRFRF